MEIWHIPVIFTVGVIAGFINTLAGGGSLLTLPILIFMGLPTSIANGTNRLAIMVQCVFAVAGFKRKGVSNFKLSLVLSVPALLGAIVGAQIAVDMSDFLFKRVLAIVMLFVVGVTLWNPRQKLTPDKKTHINLQESSGSKSLISPKRYQLIINMIVFFFIGFYGGFIQVGVGFIIIATLTTIMGLNLVVTNTHKVFIVGIYTFFALIVFVVNSKVCWEMG